MVHTKLETLYLPSPSPVTYCYRKDVSQVRLHTNCGARWVYQSGPTHHKIGYKLSSKPATHGARNQLQNSAVRLSSPCEIDCLQGPRREDAPPSCTLRDPSLPLQRMICNGPHLYKPARLNRTFTPEGGSRWSFGSQTSGFVVWGCDMSIYGL